MAIIATLDNHTNSSTMKTWQRRTLGILTLGGGAVGFVSIFQSLTALSNVLEWFLFALFAALYAWGVWCGIKLFEGGTGWRRSLIKYWAIQIPTWGSPFVGYFMSSGFHLTASLQFEPLKFNINFLLGSMFQASVMQSEAPWMFGINLFAVGVVWWLVRSSEAASASSS